MSMQVWLLLGLVFGCGASPELNAEVAPQVEDAQAGEQAPTEGAGDAGPDAPDAEPTDNGLQPPTADALGAWCDFLASWSADDLADVPVEERQAAMANAFKQQAEAAGVSVDGFLATLGELEPEDRQGWVARGVEAHDLQARCEAAK